MARTFWRVRWAVAGVLMLFLGWGCGHYKAYWGGGWWDTRYWGERLWALSHSFYFLYFKSQHY